MTRPDVVLIVEQLRRPVPGGIGTYAAGLLQGLRDTAFDKSVELLASRASGATDPLGGYGYQVRASSLPAPLLTRLWDQGLGRFPDAAVVHATSLAFPSRRRRAHLGWRAHLGSGRRPVPEGDTPLVVTVHDLSWRHHPEATTTRGRRWHEARLLVALDEAALLVVPSPPVAADLVDSGVAPSGVKVIPHGADHLPEPDLGAAALLLERYDVRGPFLLSVGTLEPRKNLGRLVTAYGLARQSFPDPWPLVVVGPSGWGARGAPRATVFGASRGDSPASVGGSFPEDGVVPVGVVPDAVLAALYQEARLLAYTPLIEGYGLPPLEAMFHGVPVVASTTVPSVVAMGADSDAVPEGLEAAALLVDPFDVEAIAAALVEAGTDESSRAALVSSGRTLAQARTWTRCAKAHTELWESLQ